MSVKRIKDEADEAQPINERSPSQANMDRIKAYWAETPLWAKLQGDLMELPNRGRWAGICESWHCSAWQQGIHGAARAVAIAQRFGWHPSEPWEDRREALHRGHLTMGRAGEDAARAQREARRIKPQAASTGPNINDAWEHHKRRRLADLVSQAVAR